MLGIFYALLSSADLFFEKFVEEHYLNIGVSISLDSDQDLHYVVSDLGPNHLQRLSTDEKIC